MAYLGARHVAEQRTALAPGLARIKTSFNKVVVPLVTHSTFKKSKSVFSTSAGIPLTVFRAVTFYSGTTIAGKNMPQLEIRQKENESCRDMIATISLVSCIRWGEEENMLNIDVF